MAWEGGYLQSIVVKLESTEREWILSQFSPGWREARVLLKKGYREIRMPLEILIGRKTALLIMPDVVTPESARYYDCVVELRRMGIQ